MFNLRLYFLSEATDTFDNHDDNFSGTFWPPALVQTTRRSRIKCRKLKVNLHELNHDTCNCCKSARYFGVRVFTVFGLRGRQ